MLNNLKAKFYCEETMEKIRSSIYYTDYCPHSGERIYFDCGSGSPIIKNVVETVSNEIKLPNQFRRPSAASDYAMQVKLKGEDDLRLFTGTKSGIIMPAQSATHALFRLISNAAKYFPGNNIVTTKAEHVAVYDCTFTSAQENDKEWRVAPFQKSTGNVKAEDVLDLIDAKTSVLALVHATNITGPFLDIAYIINEARKINNEICIIVDGVQYSPHALIDLDELGNPDAYVIAPYKAGGLKGTAFAILSDRFSQIPHDKLLGKAGNDWDLGTVGHACYAAWSSLVDHYCWIGSFFTESENRREQIIKGMTSVRSHEMALLERLFIGTPKLQGFRDLSNDGLQIFCFDESNYQDRGCLLSFNILNIRASDAVKQYSKYGILLQNRASNAYSKHVLDELGTKESIRFSAGHFNSADEIDSLLKATAQILSNQ